MRFRDIKMLMEGARIQHAEDIIFWEGSKGALRVVNSLKSLEQSGHKEVTINGTVHQQLFLAGHQTVGLYSLIKVVGVQKVITEKQHLQMKLEICSYLEAVVQEEKILHK